MSLSIVLIGMKPWIIVSSVSSNETGPQLTTPTTLCFWSNITPPLDPCIKMCIRDRYWDQSPWKKAEKETGS